MAVVNTGVMKTIRQWRLFLLRGYSPGFGYVRPSYRWHSFKLGTWIIGWTPDVRRPLRDPDTACCA